MAESRRPLHNFALPELRWGIQKFLRCMNPPSDNRQQSTDSDGGIDAVREKVMLDLKAAADQMKLSMMPEKNDADQTKLVVTADKDDADLEKLSMVAEKDVADLTPAARPWNLRARRSACKAPAAAAGSFPKKTEEEMSRRPSGGEPAAVKLSVALSKAEISEDFRVMAGMKPPRRPKKRPRIVQKELDQLFPGLWLPEIRPTLETYRVDDVAEQ